MLERLIFNCADAMRKAKVKQMLPAIRRSNYYHYALWLLSLSLTGVSAAGWLEKFGNGLNQIGERIEGLIDRTVDGISDGLTRTPTESTPEITPAQAAKLQAAAKRAKLRRLPIRRPTQISSVINILDEAQLQNYLQDPQRQILVVLFSMAKKCEHCDRLRPVYRQLAHTYPQIIFLSIDPLVPNMDKIAEKWGVNRFPTIFIFKPGANVATTKIIGAQTERLKNSISDLLQQLAQAPAPELELDQDSKTEE